MTDIEIPELESGSATDSVAIVSGGMDSTTLLYWMVVRGYKPRVLSFDYGQRHKKELTFAQYHAIQLGLPHQVVDLSTVTGLISNSALTQRGVGEPRSVAGIEHPLQPDIEVPEGHYAEENMKATVVPNRNMMMLSIAIASAVNDKGRAVGIGVHGGDHAIYPDCRPNFIAHIEYTARLANEGFMHPTFQVLAPFLDWTKADIAHTGDALDIDWSKTWSCYKGGAIHCGKCATCVERREAFHIAEVVDPTEYEDKTDYWKQVTQNV